MTRIACLLLILAALLVGTAEARQAGEPRSWSLGAKSLSALPATELEAIDPAALLAADAAQAVQSKGGGALRFAVPRALSATPATAGRWLQLVDGGRLWQARFHVANATDINIALSRFVLPEGATLHLFSTGQRYYEGPYTAADVRKHGKFWSPVVPGDDVVLELYLPAGSDGAELALAAVNAGYRDLFRHGTSAAMKQGSCNIDVVCPEGDAYRDEIRSVARYTINGNGLCTGTLVMDAAASFRPWFLTAAHCGVTNEGVADSLVVYWNYESSSCGALGGGSLADNQAGAAFRSRRVDVDMGLVELDATPDPAFGVHYAGWDRSGAAPTGSVHIHHPDGDEKAITFNDGLLTTGNSCIGTGGVNTHWVIDDYEQGTTEPGSSGSGVWTETPQPLLIGFLSGGGASCSNPQLGDCYGKLSVAWSGTSAANRLSDWLGAGLASPPQTVTGSDPIDFSIALQPDSVALCRGDSAAVEVNVTGSSGFIAPVALAASGTPAGVTASFSDDEVAPPASSVLTLQAGALAPSGNHTLHVEGSSGGLFRSTALALNVQAASPSAPAPVAPVAAATGVDLFPQFSWSPVTGASAYRLQVAANGDFASPTVDVVVDGTVHTLDAALQAGTGYAWRVAALNGCGASVFSAARSFDTGSSWCRTEGTAIPDGDPVGTTHSVSIDADGVLTDLDVALEIGHTWVGDIGAVLRHEESGIEVVLLDRPGVPTSPFGCSNNNVGAVLDDEATNDAETRCAGGGTAIAGNQRPTGQLADFDGASFAGTWSLRVSDAVTDDTGTLLRWCLQPTLALPLGSAIFRNGFE